MTVAGSSQVGACLAYADTWWGGRDHACMVVGPSHIAQASLWRQISSCSTTSPLLNQVSYKPELEGQKLTRRILRQDYTMPPRIALVRSLARPFFTRTYSHIPAKPTWTTHSLVDTATADEISPAQLSHLLRLSALPQPRDAQEEAYLLSDLQSQLRFVKRIQEVDTTGVEPLQAVRDETAAARDEATLGLEQLGESLKDEVAVGHYKRPRRVRKEVDTQGVDDWDPLNTASRTSGRYFVVESGKESAE